MLGKRDHTNDPGLPFQSLPRRYYRGLNMVACHLHDPFFGIARILFESRNRSAVLYTEQNMAASQIQKSHDFFGKFLRPDTVALELHTRVLGVSDQFRQLGPVHHIPSESVLTTPGLEGVPASFEDFFDHLPHWQFIDRAHVVRGDACLSCGAFSESRETQDQFRVTEHRDIGVVSREDELAPMLLFAHCGTTTSVMKRLSRSSSG